ncbi:glycoside hydrolase family 48 protein [Phytohabitans sp. ZYX-F-186]|uniref:Glycoside hydrolase family 48 protein n=1 Tax=Phytohabitans maris TaxID=3071409 RepID=A0ABU0ZFU8_9ACTN|nr:glycoside hydrolase family 48 protein [Phytohabitans sp. ZYX-F-186]MDQ7905301.1 glycoside hydrolase family 48 protein [Phytohabitans sp. ZYX-F-186]
MKLTARKRRLAMIATGALVAGGMVGVPVGMAYAATACDVTYTTNDWNTGFTASVTIHNLGDPLTSWNLGFTFPGNQRVTQGWSANWTQSGANVTATNMPWNGNLATGASLSIGFNGSYSGTNAKPTAFTINGTACNGASSNQAPTVSLTSPAAGASFAAPANVTVSANASDADGSISKVEFYRNGLLVNEDTTAPYSYAMTGLPAGSYTVQARAYDNGTPALTATAERAFTVTGTGQASIVTPATLNVAEGSSSQLNVKLSAAPTGSVPVTLSKTGDADVTLGATSVTLNSTNWSTGVNVAVNAAQDADANNDTATVTASATNYTAAQTAVTVTDDENTTDPGRYGEEFLELYNKIKAPANGYFSPEGVPYHSVETLLVEAPDHGHETTSEAFSYWLFLEAMYGRTTGNWTAFNNAWQVMERYIIPSNTQGNYNANDPADYAPEADLPSQYPGTGGKLDSSVPVGQDPLYNELTQTYGSNRVYGMHWLIDVDNTYGYGSCGDGTTKPAYINTYQRGPQESVWETVPHPSCETFNFGGPNGYLPLFIGDSTYARQWRYTNAPDADARAVQAAYWAQKWAGEQGNASAVSSTVAKAAQMGDYLRYAMYDKYFKNPGCASTSCTPGTGKSSSAYLLSWYYAWGGPQGSSDWAWRIGSSHNHGGYQNPFAAWALSTVNGLIPRSATAQQDWATSLTRQIDFYTWLQSAEGAIAGGATNSWGGNYSARPSNLPTFYGMTYDWQPVYHDPPSNQWFGFQAWSMERVAEYYHETGNARAKALLDKWVDWALANTTVNGTTYQVPSTLQWTGQPGGNWSSGTTSVNNSNLHVTVVDHTTDVGVTGAYARTLTYYAAKSGDTQAATTAKALLDAVLNHKDDKGVSVPETRADYNRFDDPVYVPSGFTGTMPNGDPINSNSTFLSIRSFYEDDPDFPKVEAYLNGGQAPTFNYHRFWAQVDVAMALHDYDRLIGD